MVQGILYSFFNFVLRYDEFENHAMFALLISLFRNVTLVFASSLGIN
jgi:hypothetical protein